MTWTVSGAHRVVEDLSRDNTAAIVDILSRGPAARADLAETLRMSPGVVSKLTGRLLDAGIVETQESAAVSERPGRPKLPLVLRTSCRCVAVAHIGARSLTTGMVDLAGLVSDVQVTDLTSYAPTEVIAQLKRRVEDLRRGVAPDTHVIGVGVSIGGWVHDGVVYEHPVLAWEGVDLGVALSGLDPRVRIGSHVRGLAIAESRFGASRGERNVVELHVGNVTDAASILNGALVAGRASAAGGVGHLPVTFGPEALPCRCGRTGCAQVELSESSLLESARRYGGPATSLSELVAAAEAGNAGIQGLLDRRLAKVATLVGYIIEMLAPDVIVLAGGVVNDDQSLQRISSSAIRPRPYAEAARPRISASALGEHQLLLGAAAAVLSEFFADPLGA